MSPRLSGSEFTAVGSRCRRSPTQPELPVAGRVPATHVFEEGYVDRREGVDDRDEPGQGDLELFLGLSKQPTPLNRTAAGCPGEREAIYVGGLFGREAGAVAGKPLRPFRGQLPQALDLPDKVALARRELVPSAVE